MKRRNIFILLAAVSVAMLTGCKEKDPFDTQSDNDSPRILTPYNESGTATFTYDLANPETPLVDSCLVTPSDYTTVEWHLDDQLVQTGLKINQAFFAGHYKLLITATTTKGKSTSRYGSVTVHPYAEDPYAEEPKEGRHAMPGQEVQLDGVNLDKAEKVLITPDIYAVDASTAIEPTWHEAAMFKFIVPELADGKYFVRFIDAMGMIYGAEHIEIHNGPVALNGYQEFTMEKPCTITGMNLQGVTTVIVDGIEVAPTEVTENSVTFVAPKLEEEGSAIIMMKVNDEYVQFLNADGSYTTAFTANVLAKKLIIVANGPIYVGCQGDPDWTAKAIDGGFDWSKIAVGQILYVAAHRDADTQDYNNFQILTPDWSWRFPSDGTNCEFQDEEGNPVNEKLFTIEITENMLTALMNNGGLGAAGHGTVIDRIYMEAPEETVVWEGPVAIDWNADLVKVEAATMADVPVGATIRVYWTDDPGPGYYAFRITTPWWGDDYDPDVNFVIRQDTKEIPNPYEFEWTDFCKGLINERGAMSVLGAGFIIDKITWER